MNNGVMAFDRGYLKLKGESLRINDHPHTGLPIQNFKISFEFITSEKEAALFSINSPIGKGGHDRHIFLKGGQINVRIWPGDGAFNCQTQNLANGEWHKLELICVLNNPVRVKVDGQIIKEHPGVDQSKFDWATQICVGFSDDIGDALLRGSIKNLLYESNVSHGFEIP